MKVLALIALSFIIIFVAPVIALTVSIIALCFFTAFAAYVIYLRGKELRDKALKKESSKPLEFKEGNGKK